MTSASGTFDRVEAVLRELTVPDYDLACVGTSIHGLGAFTLDAFGCLASADVVYYYPPSTQHLAFIQRINANVIDVNSTLYIRGAPFEPTYRAIVSEVMSSLKKGRRVAYAVQGSPAFHCGTAVRLCRLARQRGLVALLISGISSLELLTAELSVAHDLTDVQVYSANRIARGTPINPTAPCFVFDVSRFALPAVRGSSESFIRSRLAVLQTRLGKCYPQSHPVLLMRIADDGTCHTRKTKLTDLVPSVSTFGASATLFIQAPAVPRTRPRS